MEKKYRIYAIKDGERVCLSMVSVGLFTALRHYIWERKAWYKSSKIMLVNEISGKTLLEGWGRWDADQ